jgi:hypothetical protein
MNVVVQYADGSKIYPSYAPDHKASVISFYKDVLTNGHIVGYVITFDDGSVMAQGQVL